MIYNECKECGCEARLEWAQAANGARRIRASCPQCGRFVKWASHSTRNVDEANAAAGLRTSGSGAPICPYCGQPAVNISALEVFKSQHERFADLRMWACRACDARVGCKPDGITPLGSLANERLRKARQEIWNRVTAVAQARSMNGKDVFESIIDEIDAPPEERAVARMTHSTAARALDALARIAEMTRRRR